jgi:hypothetical protein
MFVPPLAHGLRRKKQAKSDQPDLQRFAVEQRRRREARLPKSTAIAPSSALTLL